MSQTKIILFYFNISIITNSRIMKPSNVSKLNILVIPIVVKYFAKHPVPSAVGKVTLQYAVGVPDVYLGNSYLRDNL